MAPSVKASVFSKLPGPTAPKYVHVQSVDRGYASRGLGKGRSLQSGSAGICHHENDTTICHHNRSQREGTTKYYRLEERLASRSVEDGRVPSPNEARPGQDLVKLDGERTRACLRGWEFGWEGRGREGEGGGEAREGAAEAVVVEW